MKLDPVTKAFVENHSKDCSNITISVRQVIIYSVTVLLLFWLLNKRWDYFLFLVTAFFAFLYLCVVVFRGMAVLFSLLGLGIHKIKDEEIAALQDDDLPVFTIFLPLYKEANISAKIIANMERLDYPVDKLDIKLLLEYDDKETIQAVNNHHLPDCFEVIIVPDFKPKTKPRACNYGLQHAKGEYCVIFDAEDRPEPDQLKKVVCVFKKIPDRIVCVQAKLNYYNPDQNILTKWFTIEYSTNFDLLLPGLELFNIPIPLGGTSNYFRTEVLREIGGWDPFNVTEDCDLGIRIYKRGFRTTLVDSTTWEEANSVLWNWIRQRSRWIKGFLQTHLTHMRHPWSTFKGLGAWGFFGFYMMVGASSFMMLINVFYWIIIAVYLALAVHAMNYDIPLTEVIAGPHHYDNYQGILILGSHIEAWPLYYHGLQEDPFWSNLSIIFFAISIVLALANLMFVFTHVLACLKRRYYRLLPWALLMPIYWLLISIGGWKGFWQLFTKPFYWEKTEHGLNHGGDSENSKIIKQ